jgi:hypothetical protein
MRIFSLRWPVIVVAIILAILSVVLVATKLRKQPSPPAAVETPPKPSPQKPTPSEINADVGALADLADRVLSQLHPGRILYNPPNSMRVGDTVPIQVRIAGLKTPSESLGARLLRPAETVKDIHVSRTMKVSLKAAEVDFQIELKSPEGQLIEETKPTEWLWMIKPLRSGDHTLFLSAIAVVKVGGVEKVKELPVYTTQVHVRVNPVYFITSNWKEITGAITGTGILGWIGDRFRKRRKKGRSRAAHA